MYFIEIQILTNQESYNINKLNMPENTTEQ
jgi:hypothetical protein